MREKTPSNAVARTSKPGKAGALTRTESTNGHGKTARLTAENALLSRQITAMLEEMDLQLLDIRDERAAFRKSLQAAAEREEALHATLRARDEEIRRLLGTFPARVSASFRNVKQVLKRIRGA